MQSPTASDPSFKAFLDKLQEQNNRGFATQLVQLKAEREIAGEDNDKREEQLNDVISSLKEVKVAVTGISIDVDITPLVNIGENQTKLLEELSKETALTRKLTEGSVEYDKEAAQYRNTSGRDIESKVSGKTSKQGGFIDFETARDTLSGQGKRVKENNAFSLKPINYTPGKAVAAAVSGGKGSAAAGKDNDDEDKSKWQGLFKEIETGFKFFMTDGLSEKPGSGIFQTPSKEVEKKDREAKISSPRQENPETDNVTSTGEIQADAAKSDLELSKQMLDTTKAQLTELKAIREALAPSTPKELTEQKGAPSSSTEKEKDGSGSLLGDLASGAVDMLGRGKRVAGKAAGMGGKILGGIGKAARFLGPAAAVAGAAYSGVQGYQNTESNFDLKEGEDATVGQKTASTLGGVASGLTFGLLDEKSASQGIHKAGSAVGDFFGGIGDKVKGAYNSSVTGGVGEVQADQKVSNKTSTNTSEVSGQGLTTSTANVKQGITAEKSVLGSTFLGGLFTAKGKESGNFAGTSSEESKLQGKVEGRQIDSTDTKSGQTFGRRISGGLFGADTYKVTNKAGEEQDVSKMEYNKLQGLVKEGKVDEVHASLDKMAAAKKAALDPSGVDTLGNVTGAAPTATGKDVVQASTENKDMERDAKGKGGANNTVVSNNVSSNNTTKIVPMKASPRPEYTGSSLDRYTNRITVY
jgi:hypothetical protein